MASLTDIRDTDAPVLRQENQLQRALLLKKLHEPDYRQFQIGLEEQRIQQGQERLALQGQRQQQGDFMKSFTQLNTATKGLPGGVYNSQIAAQIDDVRNRITQDYISGKPISSDNYMPAINQIVEADQKGKAIGAAHKEKMTELKKTYSIADPEGFDRQLTQDMLYDKQKDGSYKLKDINTVDPEQIKNYAANDPKLLQYLNTQKDVAIALKNIGNKIEQTGITSGNALGSYANAITTTLKKYSYIDPHTGEPTVAVIPDNEETERIFKDNLSKTPMANKDIYNAMLLDPTVRGYMNMAIGVENMKRDQDKQIDPVSPEADIIRRQWLLKQIIPQLSLKSSTKTTTRQTELGGIEAGNQKVIAAIRKREGVKASTDALVNQVTGTLAKASSPNENDVLSIPGVKTSVVPGLKDAKGGPVKEYDLTYAFRGYTPYKQGTHKLPYYKVAAYSDKPGLIFVTKSGAPKADASGKMELTPGEVETYGSGGLQRLATQIITNTYGKTDEGKYLQSLQLNEPQAKPPSAARRVVNTIKKAVGIGKKKEIPNF